MKPENTSAMRQELATLTFDPELSEGARNAVRTCLRAKSDERVVVITDEQSKEIAASLVHEVDAVGSHCDVFVLESFSSRPLKEMPAQILQALSGAQVSIFAAQAKVGELAARIQMTSVVNKHRIRHAHMVNINKQIMMEGMRADFHEVDRLSSMLLKKAVRAKTITVKSPAGTDLKAEFSPTLRWLKTSGLISPDKWGNLPGGEIFTAPENVNGVFVVDGVVGDYLCQKYGDLLTTPLTIEITGNRISNLHSIHNELVKDFSAYTSTDENSNRVGEFAIGTNIAVKNVIGHILQDEKLPGIHLAFGHPYAEHTGQTWISTTHIDCVGRNVDIWIDDEQVMRRGAFLVHA